MGSAATAEIVAGPARSSEVPRHQGVVEGDSKERRYSPEQGTESLAGEQGFSLNTPLILSK